MSVSKHCNKSCIFGLYLHGVCALFGAEIIYGYNLVFFRGAVAQSPILAIFGRVI